MFGRDQFLMMLSAGHFPNFLIDSASRFLQFFEEIMAISENSCEFTTQSKDHRSSQSWKFNEDLRFVLLLDPVHAIGKDKSTFSICVADLNC